MTSIMASRMAGPISCLHLLPTAHPARTLVKLLCLAARPPSACLLTYLHSSYANSRMRDVALDLRVTWVCVQDGDLELKRLDLERPS